jgi:polyferredoxin
LRIVRARTLLYAAVIAITGVVMLYALATRTTESISVIHDRNPAFVRLADGSLRNGYTVRIVNKQLMAREFALDIRGLANVSYEFVGVPGSTDGRRIVEVGPDQTREVRVLVTGRQATIPPSTPIVFEITDLATGLQAQTSDYFRAP